MKFLIDENLWPRLAARIADLYPGSEHVEDRGFIGGEDREIWQEAKAYGFTILTKDSDYMDIAQIEGFPPKVV